MESRNSGIATLVTAAIMGTAGVLYGIHTTPRQFPPMVRMERSAYDTNRDGICDSGLVRYVYADSSAAVFPMNSVVGMHRRDIVDVFKENALPEGPYRTIPTLDTANVNYVTQRWDLR